MNDRWWERLPARLLEEEKALLALREGDVAVAKSHTWTRGPDGAPLLRVVLNLGSYEIEVRFPAHYPDECPSVRPVNYKGAISSHQFKKTGVFCLELGPDNWHPVFTAADMVTSTWKLLAQEIVSLSEPIEIPSRHVSGLAERIGSAGGLLLRPEGFDDVLSSVTETCDFEFAWLLRHLSLILPVALPKGDLRLGDLSAARRDTRMTGRFVVLRDGAPEEVPLDLAGFAEFLKEHGGVGTDDAAIGFLLQWSSGKTRGFLRLTKSVLALEDMPYEAERDGARIPDRVRVALRSARFGIVGLGSLGSKIAVSLARMGARRFVLVDGDVMEGPNVCRHSAGFVDVGAMKVDATRELIRDVSYYEPEVVRHAVDLASATNPDLHARVLQDLASVDLLIDATANPDAFCILAMVASDHRRPLVWGEVFGGGLGGLVGSAVPDETPCPRCVRAGFLAAAAEWPPPPSARRASRYDGGEESPVIATDADVTFLTAAVTNRVLDVLVRRDPLPPAVMLLGIRRGWIFDTPLSSVPVRVRTDDRSCSRCWMAASDPNPEDAARAATLFDEPNVDDSTPT